MSRLEAIICLVALVLIVAGVALIYLPAGLIAAGAALGASTATIPGRRERGGVE